MILRLLLFPTKYRILFLLTVSIAFSFLLRSHLVKAQFSEETR
jgi:ABC-type anion transport system duplicated permease subunit